MFWSLRTNPLIPCSQGTRRFSPADLVFHWTLPKSPGPQALSLYPQRVQRGTREHNWCRPHSLSVPPLQGWLTLTYFTGEWLVKDMMVLFGGLHFWSMNLFRAKGLQVLLEVCAETLETLWSYPTDLDGKDLFGREGIESWLRFHWLQWMVGQWTDLLICQRTSPFEHSKQLPGQLSVHVHGVLLLGSSELSSPPKCPLCHLSHYCLPWWRLWFVPMDQ